MEKEIKLVVLDNGRVVAVFEDGTMVPLHAFGSGVWAEPIEDGA